MSSKVRFAARRRLHAAVEAMEPRQLLCGLPHEFLEPAPQWSDQIEAQEVAKLASKGGSEGGPEAVSIVWTNRGDAGDNFDTTFGTSDDAARAVVDAALDAWERVITSWNRADGTSTLQVTINIGGTGFGGAGAPSNTAPADGKPRTGSFTITAGNPAGFPNANDSNGWYFDPNPSDHAEFNAGIVNAFAGDATAALGPDFYSIVVYEMTHVLGLITDKFNNGADWQGYRLESSGFATNTSVNDNAEGGGSFGDFWVFNGPTVDHLMTSYNSGDQTAASWGNVVHSAGVRPSFLNFGGQLWQGSEDAGNASGGGDRVLPSWAMAHVLSDAYGYSIVDPEQFGTFYANLNTTTNVLTVRGGDAQTTGGVSNDRVDISVDGSEIVVSVNSGDDVPGTRQLAGDGNLPAWTSRFNAAEITTINIDTGEGDDDIFVYGIPSGKTVNVNAGAGDDFVQVGDGDIDDASTGLVGNVVVNGGTGTDSFGYYDLTDDVGADTYTITSSSIDKGALTGTASYSGGDIESVTVTANGFNNNFDVNSVAALPTYFLNGFGGNDTYTFDVDFDTQIDGSVSCAGGAGIDNVVIDDTADTLDDDYQFTGNRFEKLTFGDGAVFASSSTEEFEITLNPANNTINIPQISSFLEVTVRGGDGNDAFTTGFNNLDVNISTPLRLEGGVGTDSVVIDDSSDTGDDTYTLTNTLLTKPGVSITYTTFESFQLDCNTGSNDIDVTSTFSNCPYTINGFGGDDQINVNDGTSFLFNFGSDITFNGGAGASDSVSITDSLFAGVGNYTITNGHVVLPFNGADVFFATAESVLVNGSQGINTINVNQTNILTYALGDDGDDIINIGNGNFAANITGDVLVSGGLGADVANISDTLNAGNNTWTTTAGSTTHNGATASVLTSFFGPTIDALVINAGSGAGTFNVNSLGNSTTAMNLTVNAGDGADSMNFSDDAIGADIFGDVTLNGEGGVDAIVINDSTDTGVDTYNVSANSFTKSDWAHSLTTPSVYESYRLEANGSNSTINMTSSWGGSSYRLNGNAGVDTFNIQGNNVPADIDGGAALDTFNVNTDGVGTAQARIVNNQDLANLNIGAGGNLCYAAGKLLLDTTNANLTGRLNINDGGFIERSPAAEATYRTLLTSGFAGGAWNGPQASIISSAAAGGASNDGVGYGTGAQTGLASFFGTAVAAGDMLVRYTLNGDNNLDGTVNIGDFANLAANFNVANTNWTRGNYNYDLITDIGDFAQLAANFNQTLPSALPRTTAPGSSSPFSRIEVGGASQVVDGILHGRFSTTEDRSLIDEFAMI